MTNGASLILKKIQGKYLRKYLRKYLGKYKSTD